VLAGLRYEQSKLDLTSGARGRERHHRLMPSLHLSYKLNEQQKLTASYSERLQRPGPFDLNPVPFLLDPLNYRIGNPNLKPQQTQSFELGWQYRKAPLLAMATLYYRENDKVVTDVVTDIGGGVFVTTKANVAQSRNGGLELVLNGKLTQEADLQSQQQPVLGSSWTARTWASRASARRPRLGPRQPQLAGHAQGPDPGQRLL
jgi:outer membrane receptor protein involved in Fe transport